MALSRAGKNPANGNGFMLNAVLTRFFLYSGRTEAQSVQYGKEKGIKDRVFARYLLGIKIRSVIND